MKIAVVSPPLIAKEVDANLTAVRQIISDNHDLGIGLYVFPENNLAGGFWKAYENDLATLTDNWPFPDAVEAVNGITADYGIGIGCGHIENDGGYYITHFLSENGRMLGKQRKLYPQNPTRERFLKSGNALSDIEFHGFTIHILACSNFCFPELAVLSGIQQPDMILSPTDTYAAQQHEMNVVTTYLRARALDTGAYTICSFGDSGAGSSRIMAAAAYDGRGGELLLRTKERGDTDIAVIDIELKKARQVWGGSRSRKDLLIECLLRDQEKQELETEKA